MYRTTNSAHGFVQQGGGEEGGMKEREQHCLYTSGFEIRALSSVISSYYYYYYYYYYCRRLLWRTWWQTSQVTVNHCSNHRRHQFTHVCINE